MLIHAASGGLGLAAIQLARKVGARVLATAGSPEKVHYLHEMGVEHVFNSRSTSFVDDVLKVTNGEGVDVVLNSLAGEGLTGGLSILRRFGRFLDVTKRDIYNDMHVGLSPFRKGLTYSAIDLEQVINFEPETVQELDAGPGRRHPIRRRPSRCRCRPSLTTRLWMPSAASAWPATSAKSCCRPKRPTGGPAALAAMHADGTYVVTGGMGGFGREVVLWLLHRGAQQGRRSLAHPASPQRL